MYEIVRFLGVVKGVNSSRGFHYKGEDNPHWVAFLEWNAKQPQPLDLSDQPPQSPSPDTELDAIDALISKDDGGTATNAEKFQLVLMAIKRLRRKGAI